MYNCGDSYVVRIYRREEKDPSQVVGVVEVVGNAQQKGFKNLDELCMILSIEECGKDGKNKKLISVIQPKVRTTSRTQG